MVEQFYNRFETSLPDTTLSADYTMGDGVLHVTALPLGVTDGPVFRVKVGSTLYKVTDIGSTPFLDWVVDAGVEGTADADHVSGTGLFLELTRGAVEDGLRSQTFVTVDDETASHPNSQQFSAVLAAQLDTVAADLFLAQNFA